MDLLFNKNILITGGCGFIGATLVRRLLKDYKCNILNIDKYSYSSEILSIEKLINLDKEYFDKKYKFVKCDLNDKSLKQIVEKFKPDLVFHLAAEVM